MGEVGRALFSFPNGVRTLASCGHVGFLVTCFPPAAKLSLPPRKARKQALGGIQAAESRCVFCPFVALLLCLVWILAGSPLNAYGTGGGQVPFATVDKGSRSGVRERKFVVIKTSQEWEALWRAHRSGTSPDKPAPALDIQSEMILAVFAGEKKTGGYGIEILRIEEDGAARSLNAFVRETSPAPSAIVIQMLTQPYHIVKLRKVDLPIVFKSGDP